MDDIPIYLKILLEPHGFKVRFAQSMEINHQLMHTHPAGRPRVLQKIVDELMANQAINVFNALARELVPEQLVRLRWPDAQAEQYYSPARVFRGEHFSVWTHPPLPPYMDYEEKIAAPTRALLGMGTTEHMAWQKAWDSVSAQEGMTAWEMLRRTTR